MAKANNIQSLLTPDLSLGVMNYYTIRALTMKKSSIN